jgi:hypothetical protein
MVTCPQAIIILVNNYTLTLNYKHYIKIRLPLFNLTSLENINRVYSDLISKINCRSKLQTPKIVLNEKPGQISAIEKPFNSDRILELYI